MDIIDDLLHTLKVNTGFEISDDDKEEIENCKSSKIAHEKAEETQAQAESCQDDIAGLDIKAENIADIINAKKLWLLSEAWSRREEELKEQELRDEISKPIDSEDEEYD